MGRGIMTKLQDQKRNKLALRRGYAQIDSLVSIIYRNLSVTVMRGLLNKILVVGNEIQYIFESKILFASNL